MEIIAGYLDLPLWSILTIIAMVLGYVYLTWTHGLWEKQGIKGDSPIPLFGTFHKAMKAGGFPHHDMNVMKKYGRISGAYRGRTPVLEVADPEFLRLAYIKEFTSMPNRNDTHVGSIIDKFMTALTDDRWRHVRSSVSPTFTSGKLKQMVGRINDCAGRMLEHLNALKGEAFDTKKRLGAFTMDVICSTAFGIQVDSQANPEHPMLENAMRIMGTNRKQTLKERIRAVFRITLFLLTPSFLLRVVASKLAILFDMDAVNYFTNVTDQIMTGRKEDNSRHQDFVQLCLDKLVTDVRSGDADTKVDKYGELWSTKGLTKDEITANAILFFIAGYETTASTLNFTLYELAMNQEIQAKCMEEIKEIMGDRALEEPVTYEDISKLEYLDWCIEESMRLYPAAPRVERMVEKECVVDGIRLPVGSYVSAMIYAIHHNPEIWPEPDKFDPERYSPENKEGRHQCAWIPFGIGNRNCIGMRLAQLEMKIALVTMLRNFKVEPCDETPKRPLVMARNFRMEPEQKVMLKLSARV